MLGVLSALMVVKHIKINNANRAQLEKMLSEQQKDWNSMLIFGLVMVVGIIGLIIRATG